jgi:anaerobic magnesium-protoporphyrin IX monomethyl ester cyclase
MAVSNTSQNPKIIIVTIPLRPVPADFPPMGSLSIVTSLKRAGFTNTHFYNIDYLRPTFEEAIDHLKKEQPDILGISAVVSTGYAYTRKLSLAAKQALPNAAILLGGNLGASAEVLLKKAGVDYLCTGEGEKTVVNFVNCWLTAKTKKDFADIEGLAFLDEDEKLIVTSDPDPIPAENVYDIDWSILDELGEMSYYVKSFDSARVENDFFMDPRKLEPYRQGKTFAILSASKGCVARCNFCHRWDKGIRYIPVPVIMKRIDYLIEKYNVGFMHFGDENFGTHKKWLALFLQEVKKRNLLWIVSGMRVNCITPEWIGKMKEAGCSSIYYGMESGSQKILNIMEKVTTAEQNKNVVKWMVENNLPTIIQLVIGMPGENPDTIKESAELTCHFVEQSPEVDPNALSINFAQALPGTPLYETARRKGHIGPTLEDEEEYLLRISDRDARDGETYLNFTDYPKLYLEKWHFDICNQTRNAYIKKWGLGKYWNIVLTSGRFKNLDESQSVVSNQDTGYFADPAREREKGGTDENLKIPTLWSLIRQKTISSAATFYPRLFWSLRSFSLLFVIPNIYRKYGARQTIKLLWEYILWHISKILQSHSPVPPENISLRKLLRTGFFPELPTDDPVMAKLRKGR